MAPAIWAAKVYFPNDYHSNKIMPKTAPTPQSPAAGEAATQAPEEARNVAVYALETRLKIGPAIVASGRVDFPLTMTEAKALEALGKVHILGLF